MSVDCQTIQPVKREALESVGLYFLSISGDTSDNGATVLKAGGELAVEIGEKGGIYRLQGGREISHHRPNVFKMVHNRAIYAHSGYSGSIGPAVDRQSTVIYCFELD